MIVEVRNLSFSYKNKLILDDISFDINDGDSISILGANGCGKSTLLRILLGFLNYKGSVKIAGKDVIKYSKKELAKLIAYIPQNHQLGYEYSVFDIVLMGALCRTPLFSNFSKNDKILAEKSLDKMGILKLKNKPYTQISGGERQLAYIARTLVQKAKIIFMDEPTNGLDFGNQIKLLEMIKSLKDEGYTFIQTTHHPKHTYFISNLVLFLKDGKILYFGENDKNITSQYINEIYGINYENYKDKL